MGRLTVTPHTHSRRWVVSLGATLTFVGLLALLHFRDPLLAMASVPDGGVLVRSYSLAVRTAAWLVGAFLVNRLIGLVVWDLVVARALRSPVPGALRTLGAIVIFLVTITCIVGLVFERSVTGFLAALGAGGFALGLALRNLFADIFTGLAVNLDRTFRIGDWVELVEGGRGPTVGQIEEIGWRSTHLLTEDLKTVVIPNSHLGTQRIVNVSRPSLTTRYETTITLDFSVPVSRAKRVLLASLHAVHDLPGFFSEREPEVLASNTSDRGLDYVLRYWIVSWTGISPNRARDVVLTSAMDHLRTAGISPAYEKTDIFHRDMPVRNWEGHTRDDQLTLLSRLDLFSMLEREEIERIADSITRRAFQRNEVLFRDGDDGDSLLILTEGLLDVTVRDRDGASEHRVGRVLPGEFVGEMSLLTGEPRSATVTTVTPSVAYEVRGDVVRDLLHSRPEIAMMLSRVVAERKLQNADTERRLGEAGRAEAVASLAHQLVTRMLKFLGRRDLRIGGQADRA